jgi:hydrogenase-4 component B
MGAGAETISAVGLLLLCGPLLAILSGIPALYFKERPALLQKLAAFFIAAASLSGLAGAALVLTSGRTETIALPGVLPFGPLDAAVDPLSALFLLPIYIVALCSAVYSREYWPAEKNPRTVRRLTFFFGLLVAAMAMLVMARNGIIFLIVWEIMALACFFALSVEDGKPEVREAGTLYLITTHIGTLGLFAMFSLLNRAAGSFFFPPAGSLDGGIPLAAGILATALLGFGLKAGLMPLHIWLPSAHANAPSHISAIMSGVLLKMGIYGLLRTLSFFDRIPLWWGVVVLVAGILSGILGVAFAIAQHDLKRLLAYHSIENIGIITMGIGVALIGRATDAPLLTMLGLAGALLHMLNHATFKALLFFSAGSAIHGAGSREIDRMGGLGRLMPWTAFSFLVGAVAICGLPPLNGFVSEFLVYFGLFHGVRDGHGAALPFLALAAPALAFIGGLAMACFVKVYGVAFLGLPRSEAAAGAHESGWWMRAPMLLLVLICGLVGICPPVVAPMLDAAIASWQPALAPGGVRLESVAPLWWLSLLGVLLLCLVLGLWFLLVRRLAAAPRGAGPTWNCGYLRPAARMQYTASSFAEMLVKLFAGVLRPHREVPVIEGVFPCPGRFTSHIPEIFLEMIFLPLLERTNARAGVIRRMQHGRLHLYILYIFATLVLLLVWAQYV